MRRPALLGVLTAAALALLPSAAPAYPPTTCGRVAVNGKTYVYRTHGPSCRYAKRWVRVYIVEKRGPKGYTCRAYGAAFPAYCRAPRQRYFFASLPS